MNRMSRIAAVAGVVLGLGTLAACGSDDDAGGGSGGGSGESIKVYSIAPTGTSTTNFETAKVLQGYFDKVNDGGGINGKQVELVACNDKFDPNESANCAREAVRDKAVAVVGGFSGFEDQVFPILEQGKVPWVGNVGASAQGLKSPYAYPLTTGPLGFGRLGAAAAQCEKATPVILDSPAALSTLQFASGPMKQAGKEFATPVKVAQTTVDFAPIAKGVQGSDCVLVTLPGPMYPPLLAAMEQLGTKTKILSTANVLEKSVLATWPAGLESVVVGNFPAEDDKAWAEAKATLPDTDLSLGVLQNTWIAGVIFDEVAKGVSGDVTSATFKQALDSATAVDTGGLTPPLNFSKPLPIPDLARITNPNVVNFVIEDRKLVQQGGFVNVSPVQS